MAYRSDEEAALARADALQVDLDQANAELAATKAKLVATENARDALASNLRHHHTTDRIAFPAPRRLPIFAGVACVAVGLSITGLYLMTSERTPAATSSPPPPIVVPPPVTVEQIELPRVEPPDTSQLCDEVSCVLNNYEDACCAQFNKRPTKPVANDGLPDAIDRAMISDGVHKLLPKILACGDKTAAHGQVKVQVKIKPSGEVARVTVSTTPEQALGRCVAAAVEHVKLPATQRGGSFGYPFIF